MLVTPEYNGSIPAVLKNAIDWLSRPWVPVISRTNRSPSSVLPRKHGGTWAHDETRKSLGIAGPRWWIPSGSPLPIKTLDGEHPRDNAEVVDAVREAVAGLAAEVK